MIQLKSNILESSDDETNNKKLAEEVKNTVIAELEIKQKQKEDDKKLEEEKANYERKERQRLKKIQKRKRAKERQYAEQLAEQKAKQVAEQVAEEIAERVTEEEQQKDDLKIDEDINKIQEYINNLVEANNMRDLAKGIIRPEKFDYSKCPCGSKTYRKDLHEKTQRHKNYIEYGTIHKTKTQTDRNIKRYLKNSQIISRCGCGEDVKDSAKSQHEQSKKHTYFIEHGHKQPAGNYMVRCECGTYFLKYNMSRHKNTIGHRHYITAL
jgi:exonuclease VII large subunit